MGADGGAATPTAPPAAADPVQRCWPKLWTRGRGPSVCRAIPTQRGRGSLIKKRTLLLCAVARHSTRGPRALLARAEPLRAQLLRLAPGANAPQPSENSIFLKNQGKKKN